MLGTGGTSVAAGGTPWLVAAGGSIIPAGGAATGATGGMATGGAATGPTGGTASDTAGTGGTDTGGTAGSCSAPVADGHFQMEALNRGVVAVRTGGGNYVGWRMMGYEYPLDISYNIYRDGALLANVVDSTNFVDGDGGADALYAVAAVIDGAECELSAAVDTWAQNYLRIPISPPGASYSANDGSTGDLDGDGELDIVLKWEPSDAQDNSFSGITSDVFLDGIKLDGTRLWRINLGPNIRAGAHYTQFVVYDFDGDGRAELAVKTAPGTVDGLGNFLNSGPAASADHGEIFRASNGYILSGPEYLSVFDGTSGAELATVDFAVGRGADINVWGDDYGNRVDRFLSSAGFVSDTGSADTGSGRPSILMARGYYERATVTAWNWRDGELTRIWTGDSDDSGASAMRGQGAHSMAVADVDGDNAQEIVYGAATWESDGSFKCSTGFGHGDALHVTDHDPSRPGIEVFLPHEDKSKPIWDVHDGGTCEIIAVSGTTGDDNSRGIAADFVAGSLGSEFWSSSDKTIRAASDGSAVGGSTGSTNFLIWWDADLLRELEDGTSITKIGGGELLSADGCASNNGSKSTPTLTADLLGDWREEIIWRESDNSALRLYTTTALTAERLYTLMHDPQYRMQVSSEQTAYNQPPHTGFFLGAGMAPPPVPDIHTP